MILQPASNTRIKIWKQQISVEPGGEGQTLRGGSGGTALNDVGLSIVQNAINEMRQFVDQVYVPDTLAIAGFYKD